MPVLPAQEVSQGWHEEGGSPGTYIAILQYLPFTVFVYGSCVPEPGPFLARAEVATLGWNDFNLSQRLSKC